MLGAALAAVFILGGCGRTAVSSGTPAIGSYGAIIPAGTKSVASVQSCCRQLAAGQISLAQCMANPECKNKGNNCCMNAVNDLPPARR